MNRIEQLQNKLPDCPSIQAKEEYINTAILVLLVFINGEYHFVFQKRCAHIRQGGEICFPGGLFRPQDTTYEQTAIRETEEEMGIPAKKISLIGPLDIIIAPLGVVVNAFVGTAALADLSEIVPNGDEVEQVFSIPVSYFEKNEPRKYQSILKVHPSVLDEKTGKETILFPARELGLPDHYAKPWGNLKHTIYVYRVEQGLIWGITARFIVDIVNKLKA